MIALFRNHERNVFLYRKQHTHKQKQQESSKSLKPSKKLFKNHLLLVLLTYYSFLNNTICVYICLLERVSYNKKNNTSAVL